MSEMFIYTQQRSYKRDFRDLCSQKLKELLPVLGLLDIYTSQDELDGNGAFRLERDQSSGLCLYLTLLANQRN